MTEGREEVESLSDALWMLREREKMNRQDGLIWSARKRQRDVEQ